MANRLFKICVFRTTSKFQLIKFQLILGGRLHLANLKDIAGLEDVQLIFNFPYICQ